MRRLEGGHMVNLKRSEIFLIERFLAYPNGVGYVLDFSDRTFAEFFEDELGVDIRNENFAERGNSKRHRFISFCLKGHPDTIVKILELMFQRRCEIANCNPVKPTDEFESKFQDLIASIKSKMDLPEMDAFDLYCENRTLDELIADLKRTIGDNKPEVAMDHLHTYCIKKITYLLSLRNVPCEPNEALHARFGKYRRLLQKENSLHETSDLSMKSTISIFDKFNDIRNNRSLAHDNELLGHAEARYVFDIVTALLRFIKAVESEDYERKS